MVTLTSKANVRFRIACEFPNKRKHMGGKLPVVSMAGKFLQTKKMMRTKDYHYNFHSVYTQFYSYHVYYSNCFLHRQGKEDIEEFS